MVCRSNPVYITIFQTYHDFVSSKLHRIGIFFVIVFACFFALPVAQRLTSWCLEDTATYGRSYDLLLRIDTNYAINVRDTIMGYLYYKLPTWIRVVLLFVGSSQHDQRWMNRSFLCHPQATHGLHFATVEMQVQPSNQYTRRWKPISETNIYQWQHELNKKCICLWICSRGLPLQIANGVFFLQVLICSNYVPCKKPGSPVRNRKIGSPWITDQLVPKSLCSNSNMFVEVTSLIITVYLLLVHLVLVAGKIHLKIWRDRWMDWIFKRRQKPSMM